MHEECLVSRSVCTLRTAITPALFYSPLTPCARPPAVFGVLADKQMARDVLRGFLDKGDQSRGEMEVLNEQANVLQENVRAAAWAWAAHGCGHCKKVAPEYERLAAAVKDVAALTVGKARVCLCPAPCPTWWQLCTDNSTTLLSMTPCMHVVMFYTHGSRQSKGLFPCKCMRRSRAAFRAESSVVVGKVDVGRCPELKLKCVPVQGALDDLAEEFMAAVGEARGAVRARAEAEAARMDEEERKRAMVYCKIMGSIMEQGDGYVGKEMGRFSRLLQGVSGNGCTALQAHDMLNVGVCSSVEEQRFLTHGLLPRSAQAVPALLHTPFSPTPLGP
ncbi:unnamed protein product [Closterium sp. NIES-64]|nr:unnamed protein product [Closterium sp. NIES-64]